MSDRTTAGVERLRREFDERFAEAIVARDERHEDVLAISVRGAGYVISLDGACALARTPPVTRLPSPNPALLGLVAMGGQLTALYDLSVLLGEAPPAHETPEWTLLLTAGGAAVAFDGLESYHRIPTRVIHEGSPHPAVDVRGDLRQLLRPGALLKVIEGGGRPTAP